MPEEQKLDEAKFKITTGRSPAYPFIDLEKAVERLEQVYYAGVRDQPYPPNTFYKVWDFAESSSGARQTMAALNHYGLVTYDGRGKTRKVQLSPLALAIVRDKRPNSSDREEALQQAALEPSIFAKLYQHFPPPMPERVFIEHFLVEEAGYNESATEPLMKAYQGSLEFAGLNKPVAELDILEDQDEISAPPPQTPDKPSTRIPNREPVAEAPNGYNEDKASLDEGEVTMIWPKNLSAESVEDLEYWLQGIINRARRKAQKANSQ